MFVAGTEIITMNHSADVVEFRCNTSWIKKCYETITISTCLLLHVTNKIKAGLDLSCQLNASSHRMEEDRFRK